MSDLEPEVCAHVYVDIEYRKQWDKTVLGKFISRYTYQVAITSVPLSVRSKAYRRRQRNSRTTLESKIPLATFKQRSILH